MGSLAVLQEDITGCGGGGGGQKYSLLDQNAELLL